MAKPVSKIQQHEEDFIVDAKRMGALAAERKALDICGYDVRGLTLVADSLVICSVSSEPHLKAVMNAVIDGMKAFGRRPLHVEGNARSGWVVLDYGAVVFHAFRVEAREFYDLDGLWADASKLELDVD